MINEIITGEKIQQICDIYIGKLEDFNYNPIIRSQFNKHLNIDSITTYIDNQRYIFCYSHRINELSKKIQYFKNKFILITHNSDQNIEYIECVKNILDCVNLEKWYAQNLLFTNDKINLLPIGFANSMWPHGNLSIFKDLTVINNLSNKTEDIYFNFSINTNFEKRYKCYNVLKDNLIWLNKIDPTNNLYRLKEYRFCICPEGNGVDPHRLWECLYLKVVPIVINTEFTKILQKYNVPMVILDDWEELLNKTLNYLDYNFNDEIFTSILNYDTLINLIKN
jgi:hypothetical protein